MTPQLDSPTLQLLWLWAAAWPFGPLSIFCSLSKAWLPGRTLSYPSLGPFPSLGIELALLWASPCAAPPLLSASCLAGTPEHGQHMGCPFCPLGGPTLR